MSLCGKTLIDGDACKRHLFYAFYIWVIISVKQRSHFNLFQEPQVYWFHNVGLGSNRCTATLIHSSERVRNIGIGKEVAMATMRAPPLRSAAAEFHDWPGPVVSQLRATFLHVQSALLRVKRIDNANLTARSHASLLRPNPKARFSL